MEANKMKTYNLKIYYLTEEEVNKIEEFVKNEREVCTAVVETNRAGD